MTKGQSNLTIDFECSNESSAHICKVFDRNAAIQALLNPELSRKSSKLIGRSCAPTQKTQECPIKSATGNIHKDFREQLNFMRKQSKFCDLMVSCDGCLQSVHRLILAVGCPYFRERIKDLNENELILTLQSTDSEILSTLLDFMYTGNFKALKYLNVSKLQQVNALAKSLGLGEVDVFKENVLRQCLATKNFIHMWDLSDSLSNPSIRTEVVSFIVDNLDSLWITNDLMTLSKDRMQYLLAEMFDNKEVQQNIVLRMLVAWLKHDLAHRKSYADELIAVVRMAEVSETYARYLLQYESFIQDCPRLKEQLTRNVVYHSLNENSPLPKHLKATNSAIVVVDCHDGLASAAWSKRKGSLMSTEITDIFDSKANYTRYKKWPIRKKIAIDVLGDKFVGENGAEQRIPAEPTEGKSSPLTVRKGSLKTSSKISRVLMAPVVISNEKPFVDPKFVISGHDPNTCQLGFITYDPKNGAWSEVSQLPVASNPNERTLIQDTNIFVVGGVEDGRKTKMSTVFMCDILTKNVSRLPDLHIPRSSPCLFVLGSVLHVAGGEGRYTDALSQVEYIDIQDEVPIWRNWPQMKNKRQGNAMSCCVQGKVVIVGGGTNRCECIQPDQKEWREIASLPDEFGQACPHVVALNGTATVFIDHRPNRIYCLDTTNHCWQSEVIKGKPPEEVISSASCNENVYVLDKSLKIFKFDLSCKKWTVETKMPKTLLQPALLSICGFQNEEKNVSV